MQFAMTRREKAEKRREERKRKREAEEASAKAAKAGSKPAADTGKPADAGATGAQAKSDTGGKRPAPEAGDEGEPSPAKRVKTEDAATEVCFCGINHHDTTSMQLSSVLGIGITADRGWVTLQFACRLSTWQLTKWNCQRVSPSTSFDLQDLMQCQSFLSRVPNQGFAAIEVHLLILAAGGRGRDDGRGRRQGRGGRGGSCCGNGGGDGRGSRGGQRQEGRSRQAQGARSQGAGQEGGREEAAGEDHTRHPRQGDNFLQNMCGSLSG